MIPDPQEHVRAQLRKHRERRYRGGVRPAREIAMEATARRHRPPER
jgi:hypothetical protein